MCVYQHDVLTIIWKSAIAVKKKMKIKKSKHVEYP